MAEKQNHKERLKEITDSIETGIGELFESDKYKSYLQTMSRFHKYSLNNTLLIAMQKPDATLVAGFNKWRDGFKRYVKKGEKGIKIIAPTPYKIREEREKFDPQTKAPVLDASGKVQTEEVEIQIPMYRIVSVFDLSQTYGEPLPTLASDLTGNVEQYEIFMDAVKRTAPVPIDFEPMPDNTDGYYHTEQKRIAIREDMSEVQTVSATIHEVAHSLLHNRQAEQELSAQQDENTKPIKPKDRNTEEVEAESISFAVCSYYGIQTAENSLGYIATWSKDKELSELRASLETINKTSSELISGIDKHFAEIVKERGIELTAEAPATEQKQAPDKIAYQVGGNFLAIHNVENGNEYSFYDKNYNLIDGGIHDDPEWTVYDVARDVLAEGDVPPFADLAEFTEVDYDELMEKADIAQQSKALSADNPEDIYADNGHLTEDGHNISIDGHIGTWYVVDTEVVEGKEYFLLEHEEHGDNAACLIVDGDGNIALDDVWNGFDDLRESLSDVTQEQNTPNTDTSYPTPDPTVTMADYEDYSEKVADDLLPLGKNMALRLFDEDLAVYALHRDGTDTTLFDFEEINAHNGLFAIEKSDWETLQDNIQAKNEALSLPEDKEQDFVDSKENCIAIYQVKSGIQYRDYSFENTERLADRGLEVDRQNYNLVYIAPLKDFDGDLNKLLNKVYEDFNLNHPEDFKGHSLSVSDIVAINADGIVSSHYVDSFGFAEQSLFLRDVEVENLIGEDLIFVDEEIGKVTWMYFNENGSDGGHFVENNLDFEDIIEASKETTDPDVFWGEILAEKALQYLGDVGTEHFYDMKRQFTDGTHIVSGLNENSMKELVKRAENYLRTAELTKEQNFNMIDGMLNNKPDNFVTGERIDTPRGSFVLTTMTEEQMREAGYGFHHSSDDGQYRIMGDGTRAFAIRNEDYSPLPTVAQLEQDAKDGKQVSVMELIQATRREQQAKPPQKKEKTAPTKGAETER